MSVRAAAARRFGNAVPLTVTASVRGAVVSGSMAQPSTWMSLEPGTRWASAKLPNGFIANVMVWQAGVEFCVP
jgi:hypothetical protein